jgi:DNA mismatch endonuclease (patch repair protein)
MRAVKSTNTAPEMIVRRLVHGLGYRYRLHRPDPPGKPDLVFTSRGKVIFVNGCFWHQHACKRGNRQPASNVDYWRRKLAKNVARDRANVRKLRRLGWCVLTVWECQIKRPTLLPRVSRFLTKAGRVNQRSSSRPVKKRVSAAWPKPASRSIPEASQ